VRVAEIVEPRRFVEADDVDDERVAFVVADRVAEIRRVERVACRMRTAVHEDLAPDVRRALEDHDDALLFRQLDDLRRIRRGHQARTARRQAVAFGIVLGLVDRVVVVDRRGPRLERDPRLALRAAAAASPATAGRATAAAPRGWWWCEPLAVGANGLVGHVGDVADVPDALL